MSIRDYIKQLSKDQFQTLRPTIEHALCRLAQDEIDVEVFSYTEQYTIHGEVWDQKRSVILSIHSSVPVSAKKN